MIRGDLSNAPDRKGRAFCFLPGRLGRAISFARRRRTLALLLAAPLLLAACAAPQTSRLLSEGAPPAPAQIAQVPFIPQAELQCGPAATAMVLQFHGKAVTAEALAPQMMLPAAGGSLQIELQAAARRAGMLATLLPPRLPALLDEVAAGQPVIVLQNLSLPAFPRWHYAVVIGHNAARREITLHSGTTPNLVMKLDTFEHTWARSGYWALAITPPGQLPRTATQEQAGLAASALERTDTQAAATAYRALLARWPDDLVALMGLGNLAWKSGDRAAAAEHWQRATTAHPRAADAWNNLAQARLALGDRDGALAAARRAVEIGGARSGVYAATLGRVELSTR